MSRPGERAASEVIGAVLIFGFLVISFSIYQGVVVPQQNRGIEFDHNQAVQDSMQDLRNAIRQTASTGAEEAVSIKLGATYPQRVLAVNPGASSGSLQTQSLGTIAIENVSAADPEVADYFGATTTTLGPYESKTLIYRPIYFQYTNAPDTRYENSVAYNTFPNGANLTLTDQAIVDGRKLTLVALDGNVSAAQQGTVSVDTQAVSTATNTVAVSDAGGPITLTITTRLTAANWTELLEDEIDTTGTEPDEFVTAVEQTGPNQVSITLEAGVTYELRLAKVAVGADAPVEPAKYLVDVEGDETSVIENGTQRLVVEARDRFNNPVSNVSVSAAITQAANTSDPREGLSPASATTGAEGRATFTYTPPAEVNGAQEADIQVSFDGDGTANETVTFDVRVVDADGSGGGDGGQEQETGTDDINPAQVGEIHLEDEQRPSNDVVRLTFENTANSDTNITRARISFYYDAQGGGMTSADMMLAGSSEVSVSMTIGDQMQALDPEITLPGNDTQTDIDIEFNANTQPDDFFVLTIEFSSGDVGTYFIGLQ